MSSPAASAGGAGNSSQPTVLLKSSRGSIIQFILVTIPFLIVLLYFLYLASKRPAYYNNNNNNNNNSDDESLIRLFDMLCIFLSLLMCWMIFTIYIIIFVPKRRHLIGKYLKDDGSSISTIGDVIYNETSSHGGGGLLCCGRRLKLSSNKYGYAVYSHPNNNDGRMIRKRVRVYQYYTREKITILLLPNRPLSGQAKVCVYAYMLAPFILCVL